MLRRRGGIPFALMLSLVVTVPAVLRTAGQAASPAQPYATVPIEAVVLDRDGGIADRLGPASFAVTVDGRPRRVLWVRFVSRGPGSSADAFQRQSGRTETLYFAAEPARDVVLVVDESSLQRGSERIVLQAASALVDRLGLDDRIGVVRVPIPRESRLTLTTVRPEVREALRMVTGQAAQPGASVAAPSQSQAADPTRTTGDPGQAVGAERPPAEAIADRQATDDGAAPAAGFLDNLQAVLAGLQTSAGRKVIAVFSGGLLPATAARLDDVARSAVAAGTVVHAFGIPGIHDDLSAAPDLAALERLARATGGSFTMLGRNPDRSVERVVTELSACYVLGIEGAPSDADGGRHAVRIETPRLPLTLRAPAWLVPRADLADVVPSAQLPAPEPGPADAPPNAAAPPPTARAIVPFARDPELQRLLGRASDYVSGYQREYSLLVAEENYVQSARTERQQVRSDLLLVRKPGDDGWVSFRDAFEVNGVAVRDREDRLKRLFLDPSAEAQAQLTAIKEESSRYNIGQIVRNINVPLFPLKFLEPANLLHFEYKPAGRQEVEGVEAVRVAYQEWARPTLVRYNMEQDIPASGWFLVDPASGAIVGTRMEMTFDSGRNLIEIEVHYQRDAALGLWVPSEMKETYSIGRMGSFDRTVSLEGRATYSKFRRFQVKTEEQIKIPK